MKEQTPTQLFSSFLLLVLTVFSLAGAACSTNVTALPEPQTHANSAPGSTPQRAEVVAAIVTTQKANLHRSASGSAAVVTIVNKGALFTLLDATPVGPWYRVRDSKTDKEGWVHGNAIALLQTIATNTAPVDGPTIRSDGSGNAPDRARVPNTASTSERDDRATSTATVTPTPAQRPRLPSPPSSARSYVNVDGVRVPSPVFTETKPAGATARCRDGSYSFSQHRSGTCSRHGGVAEWF